MSFEEKLCLVREHIKDGYELMGSRWRNAESETIAVQTIRASVVNLKKHGRAFSWQGTGTKVRSGNGLADNPRGVQVLLNDGCITIEPFDDTEVLAPIDTVRNESGQPMVFRCTEKLLDYCVAFLKIKVAH